MLGSLLDALSCSSQELMLVMSALNHCHLLPPVPLILQKSQQKVSSDNIYTNTSTFGLVMIYPESVLDPAIFTILRLPDCLLSLYIVEQKSQPSPPFPSSLTHAGATFLNEVALCFNLHT